MRKMMIVVAMVSLLVIGGCVISLPDNFSERAIKDLSINPILSKRADWLKGVYGYQGMFTQRPNIIRGAVVCDNAYFRFITFDKGLNKYVSFLDLEIERDINNVAVGKWGAGRRLVIYGNKDVYTFEVIKSGGIIDKKTTYEVANFIALKIKQDNKEFSEYLKKEQELEKAWKDSEKPKDPSASSGTGWGGK